MDRANMDKREELRRRLMPRRTEATIPIRTHGEHESDCAVNNGPSMPAGECDCPAKDEISANRAKE